MNQEDAPFLWNGDQVTAEIVFGFQKTILL